MGASDDLIAGGPPSTGTATEKYLGVPTGYAVPPPPVPGGIGPPMPGIAPRYKESDVARIAALSAEDKARLQRALLMAGLFDDEDEFTVGKWDDTSQNAYRKILEYANQSGKTVGSALEEWAALTERNGGPGGPGGRGGRKRAPLTVQLTNPADLQAAAEPQAQEVIGRRLRPDEMQRVAGEYQGQEAAAQRAAHSAAEGGGTVTAPPQFGAYLQAKLREIDPTGAQEMDTIGLADEFFKMFGEAG